MMMLNGEMMPGEKKTYAVKASTKTLSRIKNNSVDTILDKLIDSYGNNVFDSQRFSFQEPLCVINFRPFLAMHGEDFTLAIGAPDHTYGMVVLVDDIGRAESFQFTNLSQDLSAIKNDADIRRLINMYTDKLVNGSVHTYAKAPDNIEGYRPCRMLLGGLLTNDGNFDYVVVNRNTHWPTINTVLQYHYEAFGAIILKSFLHIFEVFYGLNDDE